MKYAQFKSIIGHFPVFSASQLTSLGEDVQTLRNQLVYWQKKGLVRSLKRGLYVLNEEDQSLRPSRFYMANVIFSPSYVSMESALAFYGVIPERVHDVISVTSKKTNVFKNDLGLFRYHHIKQRAFGGWTLAQDESGTSFAIAFPEKALLDLIYLNLPKFKKDALGVARDDYRIQMEFGFSRKKLMSFSRMFANRDVRQIAGKFIEGMG